MSLPSMPAFLSALTTWLMWRAFSAMASAAVGATLCTPREMVAMSGASFTSPKAEMLSVVARIIWPGPMPPMPMPPGASGAGCAWTLAAEAASRIAAQAPARTEVFMVVVSRGPGPCV